MNRAPLSPLDEQKKSNTVISDTLPTGTTFRSANARSGVITAPAVGETGTITWYAGDLLAGHQETARLEVRVIVRGRTTLTNTVTATSDTPDPNRLNNTSSITTTVAPGGSKK